MKPLFILLIVFTVVVFGMKMTSSKTNSALAARTAMVVMLCFTAWAHFAFSDGMMMMLPDWIPLKRELVLFTGVVEIAFAIGLCFPISRKLTASLLIVFLLLILPANIYAAMISLDFQREDTTGNGLGYLWFRIPLQFFFIGWVYLSCFSNRVVLKIDKFIQK